MKWPFFLEYVRKLKFFFGRKVRLFKHNKQRNQNESTIQHTNERNQSK